MANPLRGEVDLKAGEAVHLLRLGVGALIQIESEFGKNINRVLQENFADEDSLLVGDMAKVIRAALIRDGVAPEPAVVEAIMDEAGLKACGVAIGQLLAATFPPDPDAPKNPRKASRPPTGTN